MAITVFLKKSKWIPDQVRDDIPEIHSPGKQNKYFNILTPIPPRGFTLIEILIVLVIIAVMSSIVGLNVSAKGDRVFKNNLFKVAALLTAIADEAAYTNSVVSCDFSDVITCQSYKNGEWQDFNLNRAASWQWPREIQVTAITVNGVALKPGETVHFSPIGDGSSISFQLTDGQHKGWVDGDSNSEFKVNY